MTATTTRFIEDNAVIGSKIRLKNGDILRSRNFLDTADISILMIDTNNYLKFLTQPKADDALALPAAAKDYVTVEWVENFFDGKQDPKEAVDALSITNIALTGTTPLTIDGYTLSHNDYAGLIGQTDKKENAAYTVSISGGNYTLTRRFDFDENSEVSKGAYFPVISGTNHGGYVVILTTPNPIDLGVTELDFVAYPSAQAILAGDMLIKNGNTISVNLASLSGLESTNPGVAGGQLRVKVDTASAEKDQTTRRDGSTGAVITKKSKRYPFTLSPTDITNQYLDIPVVAEQDSVQVGVKGAPTQYEDIDFTVNYTGGVGSKTRITLAGGLAAAGVSALVSGDYVEARCRSF